MLSIEISNNIDKRSKPYYLIIEAVLLIIYRPMYIKVYFRKDKTGYSNYPAFIFSLGYVSEVLPLLSKRSLRAAVTPVRQGQQRIQALKQNLAFFKPKSSVIQVLTSTKLC